jgi:predicted DNA-binding transcriptional regulator YafY
LLIKELMFGYNINKGLQEGVVAMEGIFLRSIEENIPLEMIYLSDDNQLSQRKLIVKEVDEEYIRAYCLLRKQIRTFRRQNILSIMPETKPKYLH